MNNKRATKRALLTSVTALVMCVVMLVGTTFAWFTDTASTGVNKIQAGNLDVGLEMKAANGEWVSAEGETLQFKKATGAPADEQVLWEPGCTYELPELRVVNNGNLALKYIIKVTGINGNAKLNEVIDWTIEYGTNAVEDNTGDTLVVTGYALNPGTFDVVKIKGVMDKNAGNEYQGLSIDGVSVTVYATQMTAEFDSIDNLYDKDAAYKGSQEFTSGTHVLNKGGVALNPHDVAVLVSGAGTDVTITGGYYDGGKGGDNRCVQVDTGAKVTIKDGTFTVGGDANGLGNSVILCNGGTVVIEGGFFYTDYAYRNFYYVLNQQNGNPGTITVKGGTFVNYDPSTGDDNLGGNFVAPGYSVISETKANGDKWYTVVKGTGVTAGTQTELDNAITNNETSTVKLTTAGTYELPNLDSKDVTIIGTKDTVIDMKNEVRKASSVSFEGVTVNFGTDNYKGFQHTSPVVYKDCTINGFMTTYGDTVFENCTFNSGNDQYSINFYGGENFTLTNCHFYGVNKNVYIYQETLDSDKNVTFTNCDFHMSATSNLKSAVMLNAANDFASYKYNLVMNGCTQDGANTTAAENVAGKTNYQGLYGLKHVNGNGVNQIVKGIVTIDGTTVYTN